MNKPVHKLRSNADPLGTALVLLLASFWLVYCSGCAAKKSGNESQVESQPTDDGDADYRLAQIEFNNQNYQVAIQLAKQALVKKLKLYDETTVWQLMGQSYRMLGKYDEAVVSFNQAIKADPQNHLALTYRGVVYRIQKQYDLAQESYEAALKIKPDNAALHTSMGALAIFQQDFDKAITHLEMSIEFDGTDPIAYSNLALAFAHLEFFDKAQENLKKANLLGYKKTDVIQAKIDRLKMQVINNAQGTESR